jgi:chaperone protein DnaK
MAMLSSGGVRLAPLTRDVALSSKGGHGARSSLGRAHPRHRRPCAATTCAISRDKVVGIDLGTTNSCIAAVEGGKPTVVVNREGQRTTPSVVAWTKTCDKLVGNNAKRQAVVNPSNTFASVKRFIGRTFEEVTGEEKLVNFKVVKGDSGVKLVCPATGKSYSPEEISAEVLRKLAGDAAEFLGSTVSKAVITVPAYFNDSQRAATKDAGKIAGLDTLRIINEPTAAALAYGLEKKGNETILVFDLGGGTFDVSVLEVGDGVFEVLSTSGDTHLGGDDFDRKIVDWLMSDFKKAEGIDLSGDRSAMQRLTEAAVKAKEELSSIPQVSINLPFITANQDGPKHIDTSLSRAKFEALCESLFARCAGPLRQALADAKLAPSDIDDVVLVGGSTRIPKVQQLVNELTGKEPNMTVNPDEVVALGAAVQAGVLSGEVGSVVLLDVTPLSLGVETLGGVTSKLIARNTTVPSTKSETFSTAADGQTSVDIHVLQGEREFAKDNKSLGNFRLDGIPPAPRGVPQVEVTFDLSADGILSVYAKDKASGKKAEIQITGASTLSEAEVKRATAEAEANAVEDKRRRAVVDAKNEAEALVYQARKQQSDFKDKAPPEVLARVEDSIAALERVARGEDTDAIRVAADALRQALMQIGQAAYGSPQAPSPGVSTGPNGKDGSSGPQVYDAEFSDSKE